MAFGLTYLHYFAGAQDELIKIDGDARDGVQAPPGFIKID